MNMGPPALSPEQIPFIADHSMIQYELEVVSSLPTHPGCDKKEKIFISAVNIMNPHAVLNVPDVDKAPVSRLGPLIESHPRFPQKVNAGFMEGLTDHYIRVRKKMEGVKNGDMTEEVLGKKIVVFD